MSDDERGWTLAGVRALLPDVRSCTERAVRATEALVLEREGAEPGARAAIDARTQAIVGRWAREIEAFGAEAKGVWLVDFDNGSGYYCWRWPEAELAWFHAYEDGFAGRQRIQ